MRRSMPSAPDLIGSVTYILVCLLTPFALRSVRGRLIRWAFHAGETYCSPYVSGDHTDSLSALLPGLSLTQRFASS
ncbi:hypothetical protein C8Q70DRAFT_1037609 [Cubamyces menziesii]|nr:hypothetical protein C8Q70DRAFT_1037609 [Cubamyces menziesii]